MRDNADMKVEQWEIGRLIPYARNPRKNDHAVERQASLLKEFGFRAPIIVRSDGEVVDGHLRLKAARKLGLDAVPVVLADDLTPAQIKALRISMNKSAELAQWDDELLRLEFDEIEGLGFDLELTGFSLGEIEGLGDIEVMGSEGHLDGGNYADNASKTTVPVNILGVGGMVERSLMERVKTKLIDHGAEEGGDNGEQLTTMFLEWLE